MTLVSFWGFETGGLDEINSTAGSPAVNSTAPVRTGTYSCKLSGAATAASIGSFFSGSNTAGEEGTLIGFGFQANDVTPTADFYIYQVQGSTFFEIGLTLKTNGDLVLSGNDGLGVAVELSTVSAPFAINTWYFIELAYTRKDAGTASVYINGTKVLSSIAGDYFATGGISGRFTGSTTASEDIILDDIYEDALQASEPTPYSNGVSTPWVEVIGPYQSRINSGTDNGSALDTGTWLKTGDTPLVEDATPAAYTSSNVSGDTDTDSATSPVVIGPSSDTRFTYGTLSGAKYFWRLKRGGGAGTTHSLRYGNNSDGATQTDQTLTTAYANYWLVTTSATIMPTTSEFFRQGFRTSGAQDITCADQWAFLLQTRSAATTKSPPMRHRSYRNVLLRR